MTQEKELPLRCRLQQTVCVEKMKNIEEKVDIVITSVCGNGNPGLKIKVDRLEQWKRGCSKMYWLLFGTVALIVGERIIMLMSNAFGSGP